MLALHNPSERLNEHGRSWMPRPYVNCLWVTIMGLATLPIPLVKAYILNQDPIGNLYRVPKI